MWLDVLPVDALHATSSFLSGFDTFNLSHTNSWTLSILSENLYWQKRVTGAPTTDNVVNWKRRYMLEQSLQFVDPDSARSYIHGMLLGCNRSRLAFAKLECPPAPGFWRGGRFDLRSANDSSFSLDVWFSLLPGTVKQPAGGVIYGLQSKPAIDRYPSDTHDQFILVDMKYNLYCSVLNQKKIVGRDLKPNCWYHLALTYDVSLHQQQVYIDGKSVSTELGSLNNMWLRLQHEQIGTGFCDEATKAEGARLPHTRFRGGDWYSFYGVIDEFRAWKSILPADAIAKLARCGHLRGYSIIGTMKRDNDRHGSWINTHAVRCTRPAEGKNVVAVQRGRQFH